MTCGNAHRRWGHFRLPARTQLGSTFRDADLLTPVTRARCSRGGDPHVAQPAAAPCERSAATFSLAGYVHLRLKQDVCQRRNQSGFVWVRVKFPLRNQQVSSL